MCVCIYASLPSSCQDARVPALHLSGRAQAHSWSTTETGVTKIPTLPAPPSLPSDRRGRGPRGYPLPPPHRPGPPGTPRPLTPAAPHKRPGPPALAAPEGVSARARGGGGEEEKKRGGRSPRSYKSFPGEEQWFIPRRGHHAPEETRGQAAQHRLGRGARPRGPLPGEEASAHRAFPQRLRPAG